MIVGILAIVALDAVVSAPPGGLSAMTQPVSAPTSNATRAALPLTLLIAVLVVLSAWELGRLCHAGCYSPAIAWAAFVSAGLVLIPWVEMQVRLGQTSLLFSSASRQLSPTVIWIALGVLGTCMATLARKTTERALGNMAVTAFIFLYLGLLGSFWVRIRCMTPGPQGALLLVYVLMTVKAGDIGAYFTGMAIGRHKLAPWLSPGKTIEGAVGAVLGSVLIAMGGMAVWCKLGCGGAAPPLNMTQAAVFAILMATTGHLGDLVESAIKRDMHIKDSGHLVPAFGGLLDLLDSPLFTAPIAWLALTFWGCFDYN